MLQCVLQKGSWQRVNSQAQGHRLTCVIGRTRLIPGFSGYCKVMADSTESPVNGKRRKIETAAGSPGANAVEYTSSASLTAGPTFKVPGLLVSEYTLRVPLDHTGQVIE